MGLPIDGVNNAGMVAGAGQVQHSPKAQERIGIFNFLFNKAKPDTNPVSIIPPNEQFTPAKKDAQPPVAFKMPMDIE